MASSRIIGNGHVLSLKGSPGGRVKKHSIAMKPRGGSEVSLPEAGFWLHLIVAVMPLDMFLSGSLKGFTMFANSKWLLVSHS